jgi:hypothetical protein
MLNLLNERLLSRVIAFGAALTTIFVITGSVTDPVNAPKLLSLGIMAMAAFGILVADSVSRNVNRSKVIWLAIFVFLGFSLISVLQSDSPLSQGIYGSYGRNNGFLAYLFLAIALLAAASFSTVDSFYGLIEAFFVAGIVNIVYCLWVITFGDFIGWTNPYGNILGTLGNPNFIGAFLGMFIAAYFAYGISNKSSKYFRLSMILVLPITAFEIVDSHAIQGRVVGAAGFAIVGFFYIRSRFNSVLLAIYSTFTAIVGFFALLGALQIGPLTSVIYKTSVSLRGQYWLAGWNTGKSHPISGVGMDAFGDWYRRSRDLHALELPGVNTVVNASHNVPIDMFAFGGWPLFVSYIAIMVIGAVSLLRAIKRTKQFDPVLVVLTTAWAGYQLQSIISINQIGLAIWGWILTGAAIAYERMTRLNQEAATGTNKRVNGTLAQNSKAVLFATAFGLIGLMLALPPLVSDAKWRSAQLSRSVQNIEATMVPSYFNPQTSTRYLNNIQSLEESNLSDLAHKYALDAVAWNPQSYDLWRILYFIRNSTTEEKTLAIENMKRLDPLNPDVASAK